MRSPSKCVFYQCCIADRRPAYQPSPSASSFSIASVTGRFPVPAATGRGCSFWSQASGSSHLYQVKHFCQLFQQCQRYGSIPGSTDASRHFEPSVALPLRSNSGRVRVRARPQESTRESLVPGVADRSRRRPRLQCFSNWPIPVAESTVGLKFTISGPNLCSIQLRWDFKRNVLPLLLKVIF
jgi:hypothetical protein